MGCDGKMSCRERWNLLTMEGQGGGGVLGFRHRKDWEGSSYSENTNGVDGQPVLVGVAHDCDVSEDSTWERIGIWEGDEVMMGEGRMRKS